MPTTRNHFSCGHKGRGSECRRCIQADHLTKEAEGMRLGPKRNDLLAEAFRLKSLNGRVPPSFSSATQLPPL